MASPRPERLPPPCSIADVERLTGLPRATIRIWERRYGFPAPLRDERGERVYSAETVELLGLMRSLVEQGHRPARLVAAGAEGLRRLAAGTPDRAAPSAGRKADPLIALLRSHDAQALRAYLANRLVHAGLAAFASEDVPAMSKGVGHAWATGQLQEFEEHLFSDALQDVLRPAIAKAQQHVRPEAPRVLLTTLPQEGHGLGLLMAQAMFATQGCPAVSLGVRLEPTQVIAAVKAYGADLLGLSFTAAMNPSHVLRGLEELRGALPPHVRIWAGGSAPVLARRQVTGVRCVADVRTIAHCLAEDFALAPL